MAPPRVKHCCGSKIKPIRAHACREHCGGELVDESEDGNMALEGRWLAGLGRVDKNTSFVCNSGQHSLGFGNLHFMLTVSCTSTPPRTQLIAPLGGHTEIMG